MKKAFLLRNEVETGTAKKFKSAFNFLQRPSIQEPTLKSSKQALEYKNLPK